MAHDVASWRTSSFSTGGNCVGLKEQPDDSVAVCNTNDPTTGHLTFSRSELAAWISACRAGKFDDLT